MHLHPCVPMHQESYAPSLTVRRAGAADHIRARFMSAHLHTRQSIRTLTSPFAHSPARSCSRTHTRTAPGPAQGGKNELTQGLVDAGCSLAVTDNDGDTPLHICMYVAHKEGGPLAALAASMGASPPERNGLAVAKILVSKVGSRRSLSLACFSCLSLSLSWSFSFYLSLSVICLYLSSPSPRSGAHLK